MKKFLILFFIPAFAISVGGFVDQYARRIRPVPSFGGCFENEIAYNMTTHVVAICTNTGYKTLLSTSTGAPIDATYITQTANASLTNEQALSLLGTGILKNTTGTGVLSIAVSGSDYQVPLTLGDVTASGATTTIGALKVTNGMLAGSIAASKLVGSDIATVGTITSGTWNGSLIIGTYGGTGVNNGTKTFTYLKNMSFTAADDTGVYTLPTGTKTLVDTTVATLSSLTSIGTIGTGVWQGSVINSTYGGMGVNNGGRTLTLNTNSGTIAFSNASKTLTIGNTLTLTATDGSTLAIGGGGTLGSNAYTSTAYAPIASPTFTGTVTIPTPFTLGAISVTSTGTQLNYLNAATGTTGTTSTNLVFSASPVFTGNPTFGVNDWPTNTILKNGNRVILNDTVNPYLILDNSLATPTLDKGGEIYLGSRAQAGTPSMTYARILGAKVNSTDANYLSYLSFFLLDAGGSEIQTLKLTSTGVTINSGTEIKKHLSATGTLDFANQASIGCNDLTITVSGAATGDSVDIGVPNGSVPNGTAFFTGWVSSANTVTIRYCNLSSGDPASGTFRADVWQH